MAFDRRLAREIGLTPEETAIFARLAAPEQIQDFITDMASNSEPDGDTCYSVRVALRKHLATSLKGELLATYQAFTAPGPYHPDAKSAGQRSLRNLCLSYLMELDDAAVRTLCVRQFDSADNMTDSMAALTALANTHCPERFEALDKFYAKWKDESLVMDKWFAVQATCRLPDTLSTVRRLLSHPAFNLKNPNKVRAVIGSFCQGNHVRFAVGSLAAATAVVAATALLHPALLPLARSMIVTGSSTGSWQAMSRRGWL